MNQIRFIALGDSYTIGEGASIEESWPTLMVNDLKGKGVEIDLLANPSVTGWTSKDLIEKELPVFDQFTSDVCTLLIGVNDWVQQVTPDDFTKNFKFILDHLQRGLTNSKNILIINIPDFSVTPDGPKYSKGRNISQGLMEFNKIIENEAKERGLKVVDLFTVSKEMQDRPDLIAKDNLHPSSLTYQRWKEVIQPKFQELLGL